MNMSVFWLDSDRSRPATGRHVHRLRRPRHAITAGVVAAEVVGTFILVLTIISTVIAASLARPIVGGAYGSLAVAAAGGLALAATLYDKAFRAASPIKES